MIEAEVPIISKLERLAAIGKMLSPDCNCHIPTISFSPVLYSALDNCGCAGRPHWSANFKWGSHDGNTEIDVAVCRDKVSDVIDDLADTVAVDVVLTLGKDHPASRLAIEL